MGDFVLDAEVGYFLVDKVHSIVGDVGVGKPEAAHIVLPEDLTICFPVTSESGTISTYLVK